MAISGFRQPNGWSGSVFTRTAELAKLTQARVALERQVEAVE